MIICVRCGVQNNDSTLSCSSCGHKLQSRRADVVPERDPEPLDFMGRRSVGDSAFRRIFVRCIEAMGILALMLATVGYGMFSANWWPSIAAASLAGVYLWLRSAY